VRLGLAQRARTHQDRLCVVADIPASDYTIAWRQRAHEMMAVDTKVPRVTADISRPEAHLDVRLPTTATKKRIKPLRKFGYR